jgi:hypothetical protein
MAVRRLIIKNPDRIKDVSTRDVSVTISPSFYNFEFTDARTSFSALHLSIHREIEDDKVHCKISGTRIGAVDTIPIETIKNPANLYKWFCIMLEHLN